jgi:hypothetical protein
MNARAGRVMGDGLIAGVSAAAAVALFFAIVNVAQGHPVFYTPALLGGWLFFGLTDPAQTVVAPGPVFAYNGVHLVASLAIGTLAAAVVNLVERRPAAFAPALAVGLTFFIVAHVALLIVTGPIAAGLPAWSIISANVLAAGAVAGALVWTHPRLRAQLRLYPAGDPYLPASPSLVRSGTLSRGALDSLIWSAAEPTDERPAAGPAGTESERGEQTRYAFCPTLGHDVRLGWLPPPADETPAQPPVAELACMDYGVGCTDPICPLFGVRSGTMAVRLQRSRLYQH